MHQMTDTPPRCPVCGSSRITERPFQYLFRERRLRGLGCARCGVIFIHPQPTSEELKELYSSEYFEGGDFRCGHEGGYCDPATLQHLTDPTLLLHIRDSYRGDRLLEIGCAGGAFLKAARELGFTVQGVELSEDACRMARETFGLTVFPGDVIEAHFQDGSFDVVFMGDVLEHLPDPVSTLREVHRILAAGGLLVLGVPSQTNSLFSRVGFRIYGAMGKRATVALPPYHLFEYRPASLGFLLHECGFRIDELKQDLIPPNRIHLRGPALQRLGKKLFQYPNWVLTGMFGICGDRLTAFAIKETPGPRRSSG